MDDRRHDPEFLASLALDDELAHDELLALCDALAADPAARDFWRQARDTEALLDEVRTAAPAPTPTRRAPVVSLRWAAPLAAAAVLLLAIGLPRLWPPTRRRSRTTIPSTSRSAKTPRAWTKPASSSWPSNSSGPTGVFTTRWPACSMTCTIRASWSRAPATVAAPTVKPASPVRPIRTACPRSAPPPPFLPHSSEAFETPRSPS